jgi:hypothetical protein
MGMAASFENDEKLGYGCKLLVAASTNQFYKRMLRKDVGCRLLPSQQEGGPAGPIGIPQTCLWLSYVTIYTLK